MPGLQKLDGFHTDTLGHLHPYELWPQRVNRLHPSVVGIGIGVVQKMHSISRSGFPTEHFDQALTCNMDDSMIASNPANSVVEKA